MADKKVTPKNPDTKSSAKADDKSASRNTAGSRFHPRKTGRKASSFKVGH